jgi:hypothetical protein
VPRFLKVLIVLSPLMLVLSPIVLTISTTRLLGFYALMERGVEAEARIVDAYPDRDAPGGMRVQYELVVSGVPHVHHAGAGNAHGVGMTAADLAAASARGSLAVRYLPEDPDVNEPVAELDGQGLPWGGLGMALLIVLWGLSGTG